MCDGYAYTLNVFYWRGNGKTMFSPILEVTTIQDGGALVEKVYSDRALRAAMLLHCGKRPSFLQETWQRLAARP